MAIEITVEVLRMSLSASAIGDKNAALNRAAKHIAHMCDVRLDELASGRRSDPMATARKLVAWTAFELLDMTRSEAIQATGLSGVRSRSSSAMYCLDSNTLMTVGNQQQLPMEDCAKQIIAAINEGAVKRPAWGTSNSAYQQGVSA